MVDCLQELRDAVGLVTEGGTATGGTVLFGRYPQSKHSAASEPGSGYEIAPISWRVLDVRQTKSGKADALLVSEYGLEARCFNEKREDGNEWKGSELERWLREDFAPTARLGAVAGRLICLSEEKARTLFGEDEQRVCTPTAYAERRGVLTWKEGGSYWWLRSPGSVRGRAASVLADGSVHATDWIVDYGSLGVRPAFWLNL